LLDYSVYDRWYSKLPCFRVIFWDLFTSDELGPVCPIPNGKNEFPPVIDQID